MEHYEHLILKGLINRGGSSSETYVYKLLTGDISGAEGYTLNRMWEYLDVPLQQKLIDIYESVHGWDVRGLGQPELIDTLAKRLADKRGRAVFFEKYSRSEIERMSDDDYEAGIAASVKKMREIFEVIKG